MGDNDYLTFFDECLKHNMTIEKYMPVKDQIFKIFDHFYRINGFEELDKNNGRLVNPPWIKDFLKLFDRIMKENKLDHLDEYIDFILNIEGIYLYFPQMLSTVIFKDESIYNKKYVGNYQFFMNSIAHNSLFFEEIMSYQNDTKIVDLMKIYVKNFREGFDINDDDISTYDRYKRYFYWEIGQQVVAEAYLYDSDLNAVDAFLHDIIHNYESLNEYLKLNNLLTCQARTYRMKNLKELLQVYGTNKITIK